MVSVSGCEIDYDREVVGFGEAVRAMTEAGVASLSTPPSHTPEAPHWRVLAPFSRTLPPEARRAMCSRLAGVLGAGCEAVFDPGCWDMSRSFTFGCVVGREAHLRVELVPGDFIDLRDDLDETKIENRPAEGSRRPDRPDVRVHVPGGREGLAQWAQRVDGFPGR